MDSAGIAVFENGMIAVAKTKGRACRSGKQNGKRGKAKGTRHRSYTLGDSRRAVRMSTHPHSGRRVTIVHNGIIENYKELKQFLIDNKRSEFLSDTDTEVVAQLLDFYYDGNPIRCIRKVLHELRGSFALGIVFCRPSRNGIRRSLRKSADHRAGTRRGLYRVRCPGGHQIHQGLLFA